MSIFEVTAAGFDGSTDETDHLVLWVEAPTADDVQFVVDGTDAVFCGEIEVDSDVDFTLPNDKGRFRARLKFFKSVQALIATKRAFEAREIASVPHSRERESAIASAIDAIATDLGAQIEGPLGIDSRGDFAVNVKRGAGSYGPALTELLNRHNPRTGVQPGAVLDPRSSWCYLNHFDAERLVLDYFSSCANHSG